MSDASSGLSGKRASRSGHLSNHSLSKDLQNVSYFLEGLKEQYSSTRDWRYSVCSMVAQDDGGIFGQRGTGNGEWDSSRQGIVRHDLGLLVHVYTMRISLTVAQSATIERSTDRDKASQWKGPTTSQGLETADQPSKLLHCIGCSNRLKMIRWTSGLWIFKLLKVPKRALMWRASR